MSRLRALPTHALVGMQATLKQVAPILSRSTMATHQAGLGAVRRQRFPGFALAQEQLSTSSKPSWLTTSSVWSEGSVRRRAGLHIAPPLDSRTPGWWFALFRNDPAATLYLASKQM